MESRIKIMVFEPGKKPHIEWLKNVTEAYKSVVEGNVRTQQLDSKSVLVSNADNKKGSYTVKYTDVASNYWAYSDVAYAKHAGWLNGYADGTFKGDNAITRAEVVTVVNRATGRKADESYITKNVSILNKFTDIRNNSMWYYADVMEAANMHLANSANDAETWVK